MTGASSMWTHALCGLPSSSTSVTKMKTLNPIPYGPPLSDHYAVIRNGSDYVAGEIKHSTSTLISSGKVLRAVLPCRIMMILIILVVIERHNTFCYGLTLQTNGAPAVVGNVPIEVHWQNGAFCFAELQRCGLDRGQRRLPAQRVEAQVRNLHSRPAPVTKL